MKFFIILQSYVSINIVSSIFIMYSKSKKLQDSLTLLQRDLNEVGFAVHMKAKKARKKIKKKEEGQNNDTVDYVHTKFPSLYGQGPPSKQKGFIDGKSVLLERIQQFQNRINDLQTENAIQKKQNERLIDHVAKLRTNHKSVYQSNKGRESNQNYNQSPYYPPYNFYQPFTQPMMPFQMPFQNPYQMNGMGGMGGMNGMNGMGGMNPFDQSLKNKLPKKIKKLEPIRRFRVAGYVVFFSLFFKKYSKSFTINRFDDFKDNWIGGDYIVDGRQKLIQYFRQYIPLDIFQREEVCDLDELKNVGNDKEEQNIPTKSNKKTKNQKKNKKKNDSGSSSNSDSSGSESSRSQNPSQESRKIKKNNKNKKKIQEEDQDDQRVFQFYLKIDVAVAFVVQFIKQISKVIQNEQFFEQSRFLMLFMPRQFQPDKLHDQSDFKYLNQHSQKGYSQNQKVITQYFLVKNIILDIFVNSSLLNQFGKRFFIEQKGGSDQTDQNRVFFSFFIRTTIFKKMVQQYLQKKIQNIKSSNLPKQQLRPFPKYLKSQDPLKNRAVVFENNGISMDQQNIQGISQAQIRKKEKELKGVLDESCDKMFKKLVQFRKKHYQEIKQKTLSQKYRIQDNKYFKLHQKGELAKERQKLMTQASLFKKTSVSEFDQFQDEQNIQESETSMMNKKKNKTNIKPSNKKINKKKTKMTKKNQTQSDDSSDS